MDVELMKELENPSQKHTEEILDRFLPGFVKACEIARKKLDETYIIIRLSDFGSSLEDRAFLGTAVQYAYSKGVLNVILTGKQHPFTKTNPSKMSGSFVFDSQLSSKR